MRNRVSLALAVAASSAHLAHAGDNDLVLSRLGQPVDLDGDAKPDDVVPDNQEFRSLSSELGVAIAPKFLSPADTLGYSGFQFSGEYAFTSITHDASYWCATEESEGCSAGQEKSTGLLQTVGFIARKGVWLPLPSFELGAGAIHIIDSSLWAVQTYAKFGLHEGFHDWPIPSVAARGAVSTLLGSPELSLTVASFDASISKLLGVGGTVSLEPYAGWNFLWIVPRSKVIDRTPDVTPLEQPEDIRMNFVFPDQDTITRQRFFGGLKLKHYVFAVTAEVNFALAGDSVDDRMATIACDAASPNQKGNCDAEDRAKSQQTYAIALSLDF